MTRQKILVLVSALFLAPGLFAITGCSDDDEGAVEWNPDGHCPVGEELNPVTGQCQTATGGGGTGGTGATGGTGGADNSGPSTPTCVNLECRQTQCPVGSPKTTLTGVVNIPAGNLPLPNAVVYVPNAAVSPIIDGPSCDRCDEELPGSPVVQATTNMRGEFVLEGVPAGENIPLIVQIGKWRRHVTIPHVEPCQVTALPADTTRLPRHNQEGHIPKIALTTGGYDALECLLRKIGIHDSEFTPESGPGRVNLFAGYEGSDRYAPSMNNGQNFTRARDWWHSLDNLRRYDMVLHSCEGEPDGGNKPQSARQALQDYADQGGRVFLSHWHNIWLQGGTPQFQAVATWGRGDIAPPDPVTGFIDRTFDKGQNLSDWMTHVGGSARPGEVVIREGRRTLEQVNSNLAQSWIWVEPTGTRWDQYFTFNTPVFESDDRQCGRVVFSDIHVSSGDESRNRPFPTGCTTQGLSPQEKALVFMIFDLSACIIPDQERPCAGLGESCSSNSDCCSNLCATQGGQSTGACIVN